MDIKKFFPLTQHFWGSIDIKYHLQFGYLRPKVVAAFGFRSNTDLDVLPIENSQFLKKLLSKTKLYI